MNAARHPKPPRSLSDLIVQAQRDNGRAPMRGETHNLRAILAPLKMFLPTIASWVEDSRLSPGLRVPRARRSAFELVAEGTTQTEVLEFSCAALCLRDDMVKMKSCQCHLLPGLAILASVLRGLDDARAKFLWDARHRADYRSVAAAFSAKCKT